MKKRKINNRQDTLYRLIKELETLLKEGIYADSEAGRFGCHQGLKIVRKIKRIA